MIQRREERVIRGFNDAFETDWSFQEWMTTEIYGIEWIFRMARDTIGIPIKTATVREGDAKRGTNTEWWCKYDADDEE